MFNHKDYREFERFILSCCLDNDGHRVIENDIAEMFYCAYAERIDVKRQTKANIESAIQSALADCRAWLSENDGGKLTARQIAQNSHAALYFKSLVRK